MSRLLFIRLKTKRSRRCKPDFTPAVDDPDLPDQTLTFSLSPTNLGATVDAVSGEFTWQPQIGQARDAAYVFTYTVCDNANPVECYNRDFNVLLRKLPILRLLLPIRFGIKLSMN